MDLNGKAIRGKKIQLFRVTTNLAVTGTEMPVQKSKCGDLAAYCTVSYGTTNLVLRISTRGPQKAQEAYCRIFENSKK